MRSMTHFILMMTAVVPSLLVASFTDCVQDTDCVVAVGSCGIREAVAKSQREAHQTETRRRMKTKKCAPGLSDSAFAKLQPRVVCDTGECTLLTNVDCTPDADEIFAGPVGHCKLHADCTFVPGPCGSSCNYAVPKSSQAALAAWVAKREPKKCVAVQSRIPKIRCVDSACLVVGEVPHK